MNRHPSTQQMADTMVMPAAVLLLPSFRATQMPKTKATITVSAEPEVIKVSNRLAARMPNRMPR